MHDGGQPEPGHDLRLQLLGAFRVWVDGRLIEADAWRRRKAAALLKVLALAPQHRRHRDALLDLLWPDLDASAAANQLHQAIHLARRRLCPDGAPSAATDHLGWRGDQLVLGLASVLTVDVDAFETAAASARRSAQNLAAYEAALAC